MIMKRDKRNRRTLISALGEGVTWNETAARLGYPHVRGATKYASNEGVRRCYLPCGVACVEVRKP